MKYLSWHKLNWLYVGVRVILFLVFLHSSKSNALEKGPIKILSWFDLAKRYRERVKNPKNFAELQKLKVRVPGYMVPLELVDNLSTEFLLIPTLPGCAHIPPPPADQTVEVKTLKNLKVEISIRPLWVEGTLSTSAPSESTADSVYTLMASKVWKMSDSDLDSLPKIPPATFDCKGRDKGEPVCQVFKDWELSGAAAPLEKQGPSN